MIIIVEGKEISFPEIKTLSQLVTWMKKNHTGKCLKAVIT